MHSVKPNQYTASVPTEDVKKEQGLPLVHSVKPNRYTAPVPEEDVNKKFANIIMAMFKGKGKGTGGPTSWNWAKDKWRTTDHYKKEEEKGKGVDLKITAIIAENGDTKHQSAGARETEKVKG